MPPVRKTVQFIAGLVISLLALILAFHEADPAQILAALRAANPAYVVLGLVFIWLGLYARALSWRAILGAGLPFRRVFDAMNEGYLLNNVLPFRLGELGRAYLISRRSSLSALQALSSVVVERVIDLLMAVLLLMFYLLLSPQQRSLGSLALTTGAIGLVAGAGLAVLAYGRAPLVRLAGAAFGRLAPARLHPERWIGRLDSLLAGFEVLRDARRLVTAVGFSLLAWIIAGFGTWFMLLAFLPAATLSMAFIVLTIVALGAAVPSAPGAAGVFELAVVYVLGFFGVAREPALSFGLTFHLTQIALIAVLGGLALAREGETLAHLARSAQNLLGRAERPAAPGRPAETVSPDQ
jgi:uncharacterized protein (TIRG00374 family)